MGQQPVELAPCPFCGSDDVSMSWSINNRGETANYFAECGECGASGPTAEHVLGMEDNIARDKWNRRVKEKPSIIDIVKEVKHGQK